MFLLLAKSLAVVVVDVRGRGRRPPLPLPVGPRGRWAGRAVLDAWTADPGAEKRRPPCPNEARAPLRVAGENPTSLRAGWFTFGCAAAVEAAAISNGQS